MILKYVTRVDYLKSDGRRGSRGWWVRVPGAPKKLFSDSVYGSRLRARDAALDYRDEVARAHRVLVVPRCIVRRSSRNKTGTIGVHVSQHESGLRAVASWSPSPNVSRRAHFQFKSWGGRKGAIAAARAVRIARQGDILRSIRERWVYFSSRGGR